MLQPGKDKDADMMNWKCHIVQSVIIVPSVVHAHCSDFLILKVSLNQKITVISYNLILNLLLRNNGKGFNLLLLNLVLTVNLQKSNKC